MRLDGGRLKEIQVRLFLSSRAEMQEVIETARQTTISLMQMQRQPTAVAAACVPPPIPPPILPASALTPQSPPQTNLVAAAALHQKLPTTLPAQLITQQMYQQQIQQLQQVNIVDSVFEIPFTYIGTQYAFFFFQFDSKHH